MGHDHLHPFIAKGTWEGLLVEPLKDFFEALVKHYAGLSTLRFANMCVAEEEGVRTMRRLAQGAMDAEEVKALGYDGSSSLLAGALVARRRPLAPPCCLAAPHPPPAPAPA